MDRAEEPFHITLYKLSSFYGFSNTLSHRERVFRYYVIGFIYLHNIVVQICQLFTLDLNMTSGAIFYGFFVSSIAFASLYYNSIIYYSEIQKLLLHVNEDWKQLQDGEFKIMQRYDYRTKMFALFFCAMCLFYLAVMILPPILRIIISKDKGLSSTDIFPMTSCFDYVLDREIYYYPVFIQQTLFATIAFVGAVLMYSLYLRCIQQIRGRLFILTMKIRWSFIRNDHNDNNMVLEPMESSDWIIDIAQHLVKTKEFAKIMNSVSEICCLLQTILSFLLIMADFIHLFEIPTLLKREGGNRDACLFIFITIGTVFLVYVNSYVGQKLIDCSMDLYTELCVVPIYKVSLKTQKLLLMTILMSRKPYTISIGKFFDASHEFFKQLIRSALSFATIVYQVQNS